MDLKGKYKEETGFCVGAINDMSTTYYSDDYVEWLEAKINYTHSCKQLKEKEEIDFEEWLEKNYIEENNQYKEIKGWDWGSKSFVRERYNREVLNL